MHLPIITFVSMEFGLDNAMNTYCGGLGILSGDLIKSATSMGLVMNGVTILYKNGWFKQSIGVDGNQIALDDPWDYKKYLVDTNQYFDLELGLHKVKVKIWKYELKVNNNINYVYFLDTDIEDNELLIRQLSSNIYSTDHEVWYLQEALLAMGVSEVDKIMDLKTDVYHLNESHAGCMVLKEQSINNSWEVTRSRIVFTTHTPLEAAHQKFDITQLQQYIPKKYIDLIPQELIKDGLINLTKLCLYASKFSNAVAKRHEEVSDKMYPEFKLDHITNGVYINQWISEELKVVFDTYLGGWEADPNYLRMINKVPDIELENIHAKNKAKLCDLVNNKFNKNFDKDVFTIGFARRTVGYKRANMILTQIDRLKQIAKQFNSIQIIFSGKAYPTDQEGIELIRSIVEATKIEDKYLKIVFLEDYDMDTSKALVMGVDLWLNNPIPPLEASGTSGMKASLNGIPNFSILDGWWVEGHYEGLTGWSIGQDLCVGDVCKLIEVEDLYTKLEHEIYDAWIDKPKWYAIRKTCIALNGSYFNTHRCIQEYLLKAYLK